MLSSIALSVLMWEALSCSFHKEYRPTSFVPAVVKILRRSTIDRLLIPTIFMEEVLYAPIVWCTATD